MRAASPPAGSLWPWTRRARPVRHSAPHLVAAVAPEDPARQACESGADLSPGVRLFHDGGDRPPTIKRQANGEVRVETQEFDGSYVSFVTDLAPELAQEIRAGINLKISLEASADRPMPVFIRGHFANEEGREVLHDLIVVEQGARVVRLNLDGLRIPIELATTAWVDVIFSNPPGAAITFRALTLEIEAQ